MLAAIAGFGVYLGLRKAPAEAGESRGYRDAGALVILAALLITARALEEAWGLRVLPGYPGLLDLGVLLCAGAAAVRARLPDWAPGPSWEAKSWPIPSTCSEPVFR